MNPRLMILFVPLLLVLGVIANSFFIVNQMQQAIVFQFAEAKRVVQEPGLHWKIPLIQSVFVVDKRVLPIELPSAPIILADQKRLEVDAFARYRITNPLLFYQRTFGGNEAVANDRLAKTINPTLGSVLGRVTLSDMLSAERTRIIAQIRQRVNKETADLGIEIVDVRIRRAELPPETSQAVFNRMRSDREKEAAELRAQGQEIAQEIRANADRERTVLLAEAQRESEILRGSGDKEAIRIMGEATSRDPEFFSFFRSLQAYRETMTSSDTTFVLSPDSEFLRYFERGQ